MNPTLARQLGLAGASGIFYPLCFPDFDLGPVAWFLLIPLHLALREISLRRAFWIGWLTGLIAFVGTMGWVVTAMNLYGKMPLFLSYGVMVLLTAYLGLYIALYSLAFVWIRLRFGVLLFIGAPAVWVVLELLRTYLLTGLPWSLLGYSQYRWLHVIQISDHTGVYGLSFLIVLVNIALTECGLWLFQRLRHPQPGLFPWPSASAALLAMIIVLFYGHLQLSRAETGGSDHSETTEHSLTIGFVQANIDQAHKWDPAYQVETLNRYHQLTAEASSGADLVLWPEAAMPFIFEQQRGFRDVVTSIVQTQGVPLLFGSPAMRFHPDGRRYLLNSAYLLTPDGIISGRYDKQHLVPFGEYVPLETSLLFFVNKMVEGIGDFAPGKEATLLEVRPDHSPEALRFGVVICYEVIFPDLVRQFPARGADFMVTITNDAWFGDSAAPFQHFGMVVLRAVENRMAFARAANTGVSGFIDPYGRILLSTPIFSKLAERQKIRTIRAKTFYTQYGDVFAYGCVIMTAILLGLTFLKPTGVRRA